MRTVLTRRDPGVETLLAKIPTPPPDKLDDVRRWSVALMASASRWQLGKAQQNALGRNRSNSNG